MFLAEVGRKSWKSLPSKPTAWQAESGERHYRSQFQRNGRSEYGKLLMFEEVFSDVLLLMHRVYSF